MSNAAASTIGVLCYDQIHGINFGDLTKDVMSLMNCNPGVCCNAVAHYDDLFVCDWGQMRMGFAHCQLWHDLTRSEGTPGFAEGLMVVVGTRPDQSSAGLDLAARERICARLMDRIERVHRANDAVLIDLPMAFSSDVYDELVENLWPALAKQKANDDVVDFFVNRMAS